MTKRDFFILMLKLFGLWSLVATLNSSLPSAIQFIITDSDMIASVLGGLAMLVVIGALFGLFVFKAGKIADWLKLSQDFDNEQINLGNLSHTTIVKAGIFIIGGFFFIENIPTFIANTIFIFKANINGNNQNLPNRIYWIISGGNVLVGYLLITNFDRVANLLKIPDQNADQGEA